MDILMDWSEEDIRKAAESIADRVHKIFIAEGLPVFMLMDSPGPSIPQIDLSTNPGNPLAQLHEWAQRRGAPRAQN